MNKGKIESILRDCGLSSNKAMNYSACVTQAINNELGLAEGETEVNITRLRLTELEKCRKAIREFTEVVQKLSKKLDNIDAERLSEVKTLLEAAKFSSIESVVPASTEVYSHCVICKFADIGERCRIMNGCYVCSHSKIADDVILCPHVILVNGRFRGMEREPARGPSIGQFTRIGAGAIILYGVNIGRNCIVGAGSVVSKDVPDNCKVLGVPAKVVKENLPAIENYWS